MNIPAMLRQARKAVANEAFEQAERLYARVLEHEDMRDMLDLRIRHAFCLENMNRIPEAIGVYQQVVDVYQSQGEASAARALKLKISILRKLSHQRSRPQEQPHEQEALLDATHDLNIMFEADDLTLDDIDLFGVKTQELKPEEVVSETAVPSVPVALVDIEEDMHALEEMQVSTLELAIQPVSNPPDVPAKPDMSDTEKQRLEQIQHLIRQGVHRNVTQKRLDDDVEVVFTDIGDFVPVLDEDVQASVSPAEAQLQHKAGALFGKS